MFQPPIIKKAERLGITKHPETVLYIQPRVIYKISSTNLTKTAKKLFKDMDASTVEMSWGGMGVMGMLDDPQRAHQSIFLAPTWGALLRISTKYADPFGVFRWRDTSYVSKIRIWATPDDTNTIVQALLRSQGGYPCTDWSKFQKAFGVNAEETKAAWQPFLR